MASHTYILHILHVSACCSSLAHTGHRWKGRPSPASFWLPGEDESWNGWSGRRHSVRESWGVCHLTLYIGYITCDGLCITAKSEIGTVTVSWLIIFVLFILQICRILFLLSIFSLFCTCIKLHQSNKVVVCYMFDNSLLVLLYMIWLRSSLSFTRNYGRTGCSHCVCGEVSWDHSQWAKSTIAFCWAGPHHYEDLACGELGHEIKVEWWKPPVLNSDNHTGYSLGGEAYWAAGLHLFAPLPFIQNEFFRRIRVHTFATAGNLIQCSELQATCTISRSCVWCVHMCICDQYCTFAGTIPGPRSLVANSRLSCGLGLHVRLGMAQIELNYAIPIRAQATDQ